MGTLTSGVGLASGINSRNIIDQLMSIERRPIGVIQRQMVDATTRKNAFASLASKLDNLKSVGTSLARPISFRKNTTTTSDPDALTATATTRAAPGRYSVNVGRLASAQQSVSRGYSTPDAPLAAGNITVELGNGRVDPGTRMRDLLGGEGITSGIIRIQDRGEGKQDFDVGAYETLQELAEAITNSNEVDIDAYVDRDRLVLEEKTDDGNTRFIIRDVEGDAAEKLGITINTNNRKVTGDATVQVGRQSRLEALNDDLGIDFTPAGQADLNVTLIDGTTFTVDFAGATTVEDLMDKFGQAAGGKANLSINPSDEKSLMVLDKTADPLLPVTTPLRIENAPGSTAADQLGIVGAQNDPIRRGNSLLADAGSVLLRNLGGATGNGIDETGGIRITDRSGTRRDINTAGGSLQDIVRTINNANFDVKARINDAGNGLTLEDISNNGGNFRIEELNGTTAADLGLTGTYRLDEVAEGANLQRQWIGNTTPLESLNGGKGLGGGEFTVIATDGGRFEVEIGDDDRTVGDLLREFNQAADGAGVDVIMTIAPEGDGFTVIDATGGVETLRIEDEEGLVADALRIAGESELGTPTITGRYEQTIEIEDGDTLSDVASELNDAGFGLAATVMNDGSRSQPYRLSLSGRGTGKDAGLNINSGTTGLDVQRILAAQDALAYVGGEGGAGLAVTSRTNDVKDAIPGVTLSLTRAGGPYDVEVARDLGQIKTKLNEYVDGFNGLRNSLAEFTKFDVDTESRGILLGESAVLRVETEVFGALQETIDGAGRFKTLADVGVTFRDGALGFDEAAFDAAWAEDAESVTRLFTLTGTELDEDGEEQIVGLGLAWKIEERINRLVDPVTGVLTQAEKGIEEQNLAREDRIKEIDRILENKRTRLEKQFYDMELAISRLQGQQQELNSFQVYRPPTTSQVNR